MKYLSFEHFILFFQIFISPLILQFLYIFNSHKKDIVCLNSLEFVIVKNLINIHII